MPDSDPTQPFYLIVADHDRGVFSVEGPMTDDRPWEAAARYARDHERRITCGPAGPTGTRSLLSTARRTSWLAFHRGIDCVVRVMRSADRLRVGSHDLATAAFKRGCGG